MKAVCGRSATLHTIAADARHLGATIGFFAVLHTWGQTLLHHPHLHCVIPGGGLSPDGTRWIACRPGFFLPVRVLSRLFRRLFLQALQLAYDAGTLRLDGSLAALRDRCSWTRTLATLRDTEWVVYAKPPLAGPRQVLDYVGRYTHRVAISNNRLVDIEDGQVQFTYKDYRAWDNDCRNGLSRPYRGAHGCLVAHVPGVPSPPDGDHRAARARHGTDRRYVMIGLTRDPCSLGNARGSRARTRVRSPQLADGLPRDPMPLRALHAPPARPVGLRSPSCSLARQRTPCHSRLARDSISIVDRLSSGSVQTALRPPARRVHAGPHSRRSCAAPLGIKRSALSSMTKNSSLPSARHRG